MKLKKLLGLAMASILLMSTMTMTVGAAGDSVEEVTVANEAMTFTTTLNMSKDAVTAPATIFTYTLEAVEEAPMPTSASYTAEYTTDDIVDSEGYILKETTIDFLDVEYTATGTYEYKLTMKGDDQAGLIVDSNDTRYIYVYVENNDTNTGFVVSEIHMYTEETNGDANEDSSHKSAGFTNSYGVIPGEDDNDGDSSVTDEPGVANGTASNMFIITATANGSGADHTKAFEYTLTSTGGIDEGTIFKVSDGDNNTVYIQYSSGNFYDITTENTSYDKVSSEASVFTLSSDKEYKIYAVVEGMTFIATMTEDDTENYTIYNRDYSTVVWDTEDADTTIESMTRTVTVPANTTAATITSGIDFLTHYEVFVPNTGVILQYLPFALLGLLALAFVSFKFYKLSVKR